MMNENKHTPQKIQKNFNLFVLKRILKILREKGSQKITNLAMYCGLNYASCKRYLFLMAYLDWIEIANEEGKTKIILTESGKGLEEKLTFLTI